MKLCRLLLILSVVLGVFCILLKTGWLLLVIVAIAALKRNYKSLTACGTARWASVADLDTKSKGLAVGKIAIPRYSFFAIFNPRVSSADACKAFWGRRESPVARVNAVHAAIFSPTGGGKGVSFVIPHGLTCEENSIFVDFKGEIAKATMERRRRMGHRIVMLDPAHLVTDTPDTFNALDWINASNPLAIDDCRALAEALVIRSGQEREPHWNDGSEVFIGGVSSFVVQHAPPEDRSLQTVREILTDPDELAAAITVMRQSPAWEGMLARIGNNLMHFKDKELGSTLTTTGRHLRFLDTLAIAESTRQSTFDPSELLTGKMSVYLILPPDAMRTQSALLRLWIGCLTRTVIRGGLSDRKIHLILDEANSLGQMDQISDALALGRGYGLRMQFYYQDCGQLKKSWPDGKDQTLMANCTQVFFGVNDLPTAEYVSGRLGEETIIVENWGKGRGRSHQNTYANESTSLNFNEGSQQQARKLLKPEEVLALDGRTAITFTPGCRPIWTTLERFYEKAKGWNWWDKAKLVYCCVGLFVFSAIFLMLALGITAQTFRR